MKTPIRYYLLRHGETDYSRAGCYCGWEDARLTETGLRHHEALVEALADTNLAAIYTSDSYRCTHLAEALARQRQAVVHRLPGLRELNFGVFDGKTYEEVAQEYPEALARWIEEPMYSAPPAGETLDVLCKRLLKALYAIKGQAQKISSHGSCPIPIAVVTHGGPIRVLLCHWLGIPLERQWQLRIDPGSFSITEEYAEGVICCSINGVPGSSVY